MLIDEYLVKLGVVGDTRQASAYRDSLVSIGKAATGIVAGITAAFAALSAYFTKALGDLSDLSSQAQEADVSVAFLQNLGYAAEQSNSSIEAARSSVQGLNRIMGEALNGIGRGAKMLDKFGISVRDANGQALEMGDVLSQIQERMQGMSRMQQIAMLSKLGIDPSMRQLLASTSDEIQTLFQRSREWGTFTDEQAGSANELLTQFADLKYGVGQLRTTIGVALMPVMRDILTAFKDWFVANREMIQQGLTKLFAILQASIGIMINVATFINDIIENTIGWKAVLVLITAGWVALNAAMLANPWTWIVVGIAALALAIDDLMTYMKGGESLLGDFWKPIIEWGGVAMAAIKTWWESLGPIFSNIAAAVGPLMAALKPFLEYLAYIVGDVLVAAWNIFAGAVKAALEIVLGVMKLVTAVLTGEWGDAIEAVKGMFSALWEFVKKIVFNIGEGVMNVARRVGAFASGIFGGKGAQAAATAAGEAVQTIQSAQTAALPAPAGGTGAAGALPAPAGSATGANALAAPGATGVAGGRNTNIQNSGNVTQHVTMTITSDQPERAGQIAADRLEELSRRATANTLPAVVQ